MTGLTPFIVAMLKADPAAIARADTAKLAGKYDIPAPTAAGFIHLHIGRK
ncbi:hypothetical protein SAQ01S_07260 [Sphingomonas aquatilis NBRC 16722]|uniref:Uncharacterized protein n=1 Tax=Sphingomonas aquatilis TaxID=93063 RepID=A0AAW3TU52_9SPHN|nr:hypothetical protein [Sphingomonas aquatilis]MBB3876107.1 hypothetical protein [Sphingomonas aquatilis]GEM70960.1 hypothetical protein SAQ01S_07260 [Sphingomonas aquatilis NBRC 16722]